MRSLLNEELELLFRQESLWALVIQTNPPDRWFYRRGGTVFSLVYAHGLIFSTFRRGFGEWVYTRGVKFCCQHTKNVSFLRLEDVLFTGIVAENAEVHHHGAGLFGYKVGRETRNLLRLPSSFIFSPPLLLTLAIILVCLLLWDLLLRY